LSAARHIVGRLAAMLRSLARAETGVAAVEFAIITPFLILLYFGSIEISDLIAVDRRVTVVSGTTGDLVARTDSTITTATLSDYFKAAEGIIMPYSKTPLKQVVSVVSVSSTGVTSVVWSCGYNGGVAKTAGDPYSLPTPMIDISKSNWVIVSSASYSYKPLLGQVVTRNISLNRESYYLPRFGTVINKSGACPT
jgi:Flp pilus assembly protein TadG